MFFTGCEKSSDITYLVDQQSLGIWPVAAILNEDVEVTEVFRSLPEEKFDIYFEKTAEKLVNETIQDWPEDMQTSEIKNDVIHFYKEVYADLQVRSKELFGKSFNQVSKEEALTLIDKEYMDILEEKVQKTTKESVQEYWYGYMNASPSSIQDGKVSISRINTAANYKQVTVVPSDMYGNYLHISSREEGELLMDYLEQLNEQQLVIWESYFGEEFVSMRTYQVQSNSIDAYLDKAIATLLNPDGYLMIDNVLYRDDYRNNKHYRVTDDGSEILYDVDSESDITKSSTS